MCLIAFSWKQQKNHDLVLVANRDEFYERPTQAASFWKDHPNILGGRDLQNGGTWMGITRSGRFAALTNYRDIKNVKAVAPSRGNLTSNFLKGSLSPKEYLKSLLDTSDQYNGFNLIVGNRNELYYHNNVNHVIKSLEPGLYGLSNALLDDPWTKVIKSKEKLSNLITEDPISIEKLSTALNDKAISEDALLPNTGLSMDMERALSAMHIATDSYGTRCNTALIMTQEQITFREETMNVRGQSPGTVELTF